MFSSETSDWRNVVRLHTLSLLGSTEFVLNWINDTRNIKEFKITSLTYFDFLEEKNYNWPVDINVDAMKKDLSIKHIDSFFLNGEYKGYEVGISIEMRSAAIRLYCTQDVPKYIMQSLEHELKLV